MMDTSKIDILESYRTAVAAIEGGKSINEDIGDFLVKKVMDKRKDFVKTKMDSGLFNPMKNAMKSIMKGNYQDAVTKMQRYDITLNTAAPTGIKIFGKRYEKIPFGIAAVAFPISKRGDNTPIKRINSADTIIREMFSNEIQAEMSIKATEVHKFQDILSFVLTAGGTKSIKKMSDEEDVSLLTAIENLMQSGWNPGNLNQSMPGLVEFLMKADAKETVAALFKNRKITLSPNMISNYGIKETDKMYGFIREKAPHPFYLHNTVMRPDLVGEFASNMKNVGYDVNAGAGAKVAVGIDAIFAIHDELNIILKEYLLNNEQITNKQEINIFAGSPFSQAKGDFTKAKNEYAKLSKSGTFDDKAKDKFGNRVSNDINVMVNSMNKCLRAAKLPTVELLLQSRGLSDKITHENLDQCMAELGVNVQQSQQTAQKKAVNSKNQNAQPQQQNAQQNQQAAQQQNP